MVEKIILVAGMPGSGKGVVSEVAKSLGIPVIIMGDVLREIAISKGLEINDANLGKLALDLRKKIGRHIIALYSLEKAKRLKNDIVLIEGLRNIEEYDYLKQNVKNLVLIAVHASPKTRFERLRKRGRKDDPKTFEDFEARDRRELKMGIGSVIALADIMLVNEDISLDEFRSIVEKQMIEILEKGRQK